LETVAKKRLYEGMFLVDSALAGADWDGVMTAIKRVLERADAEIVSIKKWDDRRLAYDVKHVSRGTYILTYFRTDGKNIQDIEKAVQLSERILRVLILTADYMTAEDMEKDTPATKAEKEKEERKPIPAKKSGEKGEEKPQDNQQADKDTKEKPKEPETTKEGETKEDAEDAEKAEKAEKANEAEQTKEEEQPKTPADD
jgi:small subunit ribosomal protein S6